MAAAKFVQPDYTTDTDASAYPLKIDAALAALARKASWFNAHEQDVGSPQPDMTVRIQAGWVWNGTSLTEVAAQTVSGFTTPSAGQHRIDRVVMNPLTGACSRVAGTAVTGSPSAVAPAITTGFLPVCQILFADSSTAITNSMITDERGPTVNTGSVKLATGTVAAAATFDLVLTSYLQYFKTLRLEIENLLPATDDVELRMRTSTDGGSSYDAGVADYGYAVMGQAVGAAANNVDVSDSEIVIAGGSGATRALGNAATEGFSGEIVLHDFTETTCFKKITATGGFVDPTATNPAGGGEPSTISSMGMRWSAGDIDAIRLIMESGNIATMKWTLKGDVN